MRSLTECQEPFQSLLMFGARIMAAASALAEGRPAAAVNPPRPTVAKASEVGVVALEKATARSSAVQV